MHLIVLTTFNKNMSRYKFRSIICCHSYTVMVSAYCATCSYILWSYVYCEIFISTVYQVQQYTKSIIVKFAVLP